MKNFLQRISSRKFLIALAAQLAAVAAVFWPQRGDAISDAAVKIAALAAMLLAALGYGKTEASLDASNPPASPEDSNDQQ